MRLESIDFARSSSARSEAERPRPIDEIVEHAHARLRAFGKMFLEASVRAIMLAFFVKRPGGG